MDNYVIWPPLLAWLAGQAFSVGQFSPPLYVVVINNTFVYDIRAIKLIIVKIQKETTTFTFPTLTLKSVLPVCMLISRMITNITQYLYSRGTVRQVFLQHTRRIWFKLQRKTNLVRWIIIIIVSLNICTRCLYFDSPYSLIKVWYDS